MRTWRRHRPSGDRGSGTVLVLAVAAVVVLVIGLLASLAGGLLIRSRAQGAADLAAVAAAQRRQRQTLFGSVDGAPGAGDGSPCALAGEVAVRNGARVRACEPGVRGDVVVDVVVAGAAWTVTARARAGPRAAGASS